MPRPTCHIAADVCKQSPDTYLGRDSRGPGIGCGLLFECHDVVPGDISVSVVVQTGNRAYCVLGCYVCTYSQMSLKIAWEEPNKSISSCYAWTISWPSN